VLINSLESFSTVFHLNTKNSPKYSHQLSRPQIKPTKITHPKTKNTLVK